MRSSLARPDYRSYGRTAQQARPRKLLTGPATDPQLTWMAKLLTMRVVEPAKLKVLTKCVATDSTGAFTRAVPIPGDDAHDQAERASRMIDWLKPLPVPQDAPSPDPFPDVPAAHYAVEFAGEVRTVRVDRPERGQYAGRTFVRAIVSGHSSDNVPGRELRPILEAILRTGVLGCAENYARVTSRCCVCNYELDEESREYGIGPDCGGRGRDQTKRGARFFAAIAKFVEV